MNFQRKRIIITFANPKTKWRGVAQPGSARRSGRRGRRFESCHPDFKKVVAKM